MPTSNRYPRVPLSNGEIQRREGGDESQDSNAKKEKDGYDLLSEAMTKLMLRHPVDETTDLVASVNCGAGAGGVLVDP